MAQPKVNKQEHKAYEEALRKIEECGRKGEKGTSLLLRGMGLRELPPEIGRLKYLQALFLSNNELQALPSEIGRLSALWAFSVLNNQLKELPAEIGELKALRFLSVSENQLTHLPPEIGNLESLETLDLASNHLRFLPREITMLTRLERAYLHHNPVLQLPAEVLGPARWDELPGEILPASPRAMFDFYFRRKEQGQEPIREVRVLMVGRGHVGKTSLLRALRDLKPNRHEHETHGITVKPMELRCLKGRVTAHTWDFGGQEFLHGTHQIFLSERCVYVLVLEGRDSTWELETDYWVRFIQSFGGNSPLVIVQNKSDEVSFSIDRYRLKEQCPQIVGFVETDAFTGRGVEELRKLLEHTVNGMEHVWLGVPKKWHEVKLELTEMSQNFLGYEEYQSCCEAMGVTDEQEQNSLAEMLHRLGIALNFREHKRLRDTSVLKPQWVTGGIYGLLRFAQQKQCHGMLEREWVGEALPVREYPKSKHGFMLELLEKFEVAFAAEEQGHSAGERNEPARWLIPELFQEVQPAAFEEFRAPGVKRIRFSYPQALPPALLPRLIVRTHEMSARLPLWRWRSGVVLEWAGSRALVRLERQQRRTTVEVMDGTKEERQALFDIIRAHLTVLHGNAPALEEVQVMEEPEKWVPMSELRAAEREKDESLKVTLDGDPDAQRIKLPVAATLNAVESEAARKAAGLEAEKRMHLFVSYAHADEKQLTPFRAHLTLLSQQGYIQTWNDRELVAGEKLEGGILEALRRTDVVLLFYTTAARASKFMQQKEIPLLLERANQGQCAIIWVPLERKDLEEKHPLEKRLKTFPCATRNAHPIYDFEMPQKGWMEVEQSIRKAVEQRRRNVEVMPNS